MTAPVTERVERRITPAHHRHHHIVVPRLWRDVLLVVVVVAVIAAVHARGMDAAPIRFDDEGTYVAQARAVLEQHQLSPYTYWYDHPPLGWLLIAAWMGTLGRLVSAPSLIGEGRAFMLVLDVVLALLVIVVARRIGLSRIGSGAAAVLLALSPLSLAYHRMVLLDNIVMVLLFGAWALALSRGRHLRTALLVGLLIGAAVMVKATALLLVPFVLWSAWRSWAGPTRRIAMTVIGVGALLVVAFYPLYSLIKGELLPSSDRVSLWQGIVFQLFSRPSSGSVLVDGSSANDVVAGWLHYDPYLLALGAGCAVLALLSWRLRPFAAALVFLVAFLLRPGYLPMPYVVALLPLAAICLAGVSDLTLRFLARRAVDRRLGLRIVIPGLALGMVAALVAIGGVALIRSWPAGISRMSQMNLDQPYAASSAWLAQNMPRDTVLAVDNVTWTDLVGAGYPEENLIWFYRLDSDPIALGKRPKDVAYIVAGDTMRVLLPQRPVLKGLMDRAVPVRRWGSGPTAVVVWQVRREHPAA